MVSADVFNSAPPVATSTAPSTVVPSRNVTLPAASPGVTAAFSVTSAPTGAVPAGVAVRFVVVGVAAAALTAQESPVTWTWVVKNSGPKLVALRQKSRISYVPSSDPSGIAALSRASSDVPVGTSAVTGPWS